MLGSATCNEGNQQDFLIQPLTLIMARQEHVHIISAGENIHKTYPAAIRDLQDISHTFVFADTEIYTNSAGSKDLSMALFLISFWLEGDAYYAFGDRKGEGTPLKLAVPKVPARDVWANQNYMKILSVLGSTPGVKEPSPRVLPRN
jgi:hypothetical protein